MGKWEFIQYILALFELKILTANEELILIEPDVQDCDLRITDYANVVNYTVCVRKRERKWGGEVTYWYDFEHKIVTH